MTVYSARLGNIEDAQLRAVTRKANLGAFVSASPVSGGLFGQNVFVTTTSGDYVFRGAPHWHNGAPNDAWQFPKERLYADLLHARARAPVAWPPHLDDSCEDFPWPYLIVPRLSGVCLSAPTDRAALSDHDGIEIANALGRTLADLQSLRRDQAGDFDPDLQAIAPYPGGYSQHLRTEIEQQAAAARINQAFGPQDDSWLDALFAAEAAHPAETSPVTFAHNDYHLGNVLLEQKQTDWRVSGVIDLMTCNFGDPAADLVRQSCDWLDRAPQCTDAYLLAYRQAGGCAAPTPARLALLVVYERLLIWSYFTRPDVAHAAFKSQTFRSWAEPYVVRFAQAWSGVT